MSSIGRKCKDRFAYLMIGILILCLSPAHSEECVYPRSDGSFAKAPSLEMVPSAYRGQARCFSDDAGFVNPKDIDLKGNLRKELISTPLGRVTLRWPRSVEGLFGRSPVRAMTDAMTASSKALKVHSFAPELQNLFIDWDVVFMDEQLPTHQIPQEVVSQCHPGWMTPPANIFIVAQRAAQQCSGGTVSAQEADGRLAQVLIHEIGHVIEARLIGSASIPFDRMRAEGFAAWFEQLASNYSSLVPKGRARRDYNSVALQLFAQSTSPYLSFTGSYADYARAATLIGGIAEGKSIKDLMSVYKALESQNGDFYSSVEKVTGWKPATLLQKAVAYTKSN